MHKQRICLCQHIDLCNLTTKYCNRIASEVYRAIIVELIREKVVVTDPYSKKPRGVLFEHTRSPSGKGLNIKLTIFEPNNIEKLDENADLIREFMLYLLRIIKFRYKMNEVALPLGTQLASVQQKLHHRLKPLSK